MVLNRTPNVWRVIRSSGYEKGSRRDFTNSSDARDYFQHIADEIASTGEIDDRVVLYRIRYYAGTRYQDAVRFAIKSPHGMLVRSTPRGPRSWQEAEQTIEKVRGQRRAHYEDWKARIARIREAYIPLIKPRVKE